MKGWIETAFEESNQFHSLSLGGGGEGGGG